MPAAFARYAFCTLEPFWRFDTEPPMADAEPTRLTREQCLAKARECHELAKHGGTTPSHADMLEAMAESWENIANDHRYVRRPRA